MASISLLINIGIPATLLLLAYFIGSTVERRHLASLQWRERHFRGFPVLNFETLPPEWEVSEARLATGSVVVSVDYFKRFLAGLRMFFGGRLGAYEPLLDRGRREAIMRMVESSRRAGFDAVVNVRLDTSTLATSSGRTIAGIEMLASGTAVILRDKSVLPGAQNDAPAE